MTFFKASKSHKTHPHSWKRSKYYDDVDIFALDEGTCNGPECLACGLIFCEHCRPELISSRCPNYF